VVDTFAAAAEPNRRRLLQLLAAGPRSVTDLASTFPVTRSAISQHLLILEEVGLVTARKEGRQRFYAIDPVGVARLRAEIDLFWTDELDLLVADAKALARPGRQPAPTPSSPPSSPPINSPDPEPQGDPHDHEPRLRGEDRVSPGER
jgi:DNA-binding transcriptional ArsR family regulator